MKYIWIEPREIFIFSIGPLFMLFYNEHMHWTDGTEEQLRFLNEI